MSDSSLALIFLVGWFVGFWCLSLLAFMAKWERTGQVLAILATINPIGFIFAAILTFRNPERYNRHRRAKRYGW